MEIGLDKLPVFLFFAVPGVIALYVRAQFTTGRLPAIGEGIVAYVILSLVYHAAAYPFVPGLYAGDWSSSWNFAGWFLLIFLLPALVGLLLGLNIRKDWTRTLLTKWGISTIHPIESAWDWHFSRCEPCWVTIVLKNGTVWRGYLGVGSFMSSRSEERDILVEQVYAMDDDEVWKPRSSSVWIAHGEIQSIELWPRDTRKDDDVGQEGNTRDA